MNATSGPAQPEPTDTLELLMVDQRLIEMCELQRVSDSLLDVIPLSENQHSATLAWLFDGREGHGQGDEILRDLLAYASVQATAEKKLAKNRSTWKFFQNWPASRIRTTSFGSAFTSREFVIDDKQRLDLVVIDPQNKFVLVIENKSGTKQRPEQLDPYRRSTDTVIASNGRLREYTPVYLALDRFFDYEEDTFASEKTWLHLSYDWLEASALRATMHVKRGNDAARLVMSYCAKVTGTESDAAARLTELAGELHIAYPTTLESLVDTPNRQLAGRWLANPNDEAGLLFLLQNRGVALALKETRGMVSVASAIKAAGGSLPVDNVYVFRVRVTVCPTGWEQFQGAEGNHPVFFSVRYTNEDRRTYSVQLCFHVESLASPEDAERVRKMLSAVEPGFTKNAASQLRRVDLVKNVKLVEVVKVVKELNDKLQRVLATASEK